MEKLLLHITELVAWVSSGRLKINLSRIVAFDSTNLEYSFKQMLEEFGNVRAGDPEAYVIASLNRNWRQYIKEPNNISRALFQTLDLAVINDIQPLTRDAAIRLGSQIERLAIMPSSPEFEGLWEEYQKQIKYEEARESAKDFIKLFTFPEYVTQKIPFFDDTKIEAIFKNSFTMEQQKSLEERKGTSEYGLMEFMISIASTQPREWLDSNEDYQLLRSERQSFLFEKNWNEVTYLESENILMLIHKFNELSLEKLSFDPVSLISFYKHKSEFILNGQKMNFASLRKDIELMLSHNYEESIFTLLSLLGVYIGLENVMYIKFNLSKKSYSIFNGKENEELDPQYFSIALEINNKTSQNTEVFARNTSPELSQLPCSEESPGDRIPQSREVKIFDKSTDSPVLESQVKSVQSEFKIPILSDKSNEIKES